MDAVDGARDGAHLATDATGVPPPPPRVSTAPGAVLTSLHAGADEPSRARGPQGTARGRSEEMARAIRERRASREIAGGDGRSREIAGGGGGGGALSSVRSARAGCGLGGTSAAAAAERWALARKGDN